MQQLFFHSRGEKFSPIDAAEIEIEMLGNTHARGALNLAHSLSLALSSCTHSLTATDIELCLLTNLILGCLLWLWSFTTVSFPEQTWLARLLSYTQSALADCAYKFGPLHSACAACTHTHTDTHAATKPEQGALAGWLLLSDTFQPKSFRQQFLLFICKSAPVADGGAIFEQCKYLEIYP
jgi:hypothetical protein